MFSYFMISKNSHTSNPYQFQQNDFAGTERDYFYTTILIDDYICGLVHSSQKKMRRLYSNVWSSGGCMAFLE